MKESKDQATVEDMVVKNAVPMGAVMTTSAQLMKHYRSSVFE